MCSNKRIRSTKGVKIEEYFTVQETRKNKRQDFLLHQTLRRWHKTSFGAIQKDLVSCFGMSLVSWNTLLKGYVRICHKFFSKMLLRLSGCCAAASESQPWWHVRFALTHGDLPQRPHRSGCSSLARSHLTPEKVVVTFTHGESEEGREEGRRTSEHLQEEEMRLLTRIDENNEIRDRSIVTDHTHLPDQLPDHPRSSLGRPYRTQGLYQANHWLDTRPHNRFTIILPSDHQTAHPPATRSFTQSSCNHIVREHQPDCPYKTQGLRDQSLRTRAQDLDTGMLTCCLQPDHPCVQPPDQRPHTATNLPVQPYQGSGMKEWLGTCQNQNVFYTNGLRLVPPLGNLLK